MVRPSQRREMAKWAVDTRGATIRQACTDFVISETCFRYQAKLSDENTLIADWLIRRDNSDAFCAETVQGFFASLCTCCNAQTLA